MLCSEEFWVLLWSLPWSQPQTSSSSGLHCLQVIVTPCVTSWHSPEQELQPCCHIPLPSLASILLSVLIASQTFSFSICFISHGIASMGGSSACVSRRVVCEWLRRWLSCSCAPCCHHADHCAALQVSHFLLGVSGELKLPPFCLKAFHYKMQKSWSYLRSSWAVCAARAGAQLGLTVSVPCSCSFGKSPAKENSIVSNLNVFLGSLKCMLEPTGSIPCCLWGYHSAWVTIVNLVHGLFFQT